MPLRPQDLYIHFINVGDGDSIVITFPEKNGVRKYAVVDCYGGAYETKVVDFVDRYLEAPELEFVCATHPHDDHIGQMAGLLTTYNGRIVEFWDSGWRHTIPAYMDVLEALLADDRVRVSRVTAGYERNINDVKVTVLAPSMYLRNRYDTYGIDLNNASVVLKLEYKDLVVILGGDAQFLSWSKILHDFPNFMKTKCPEIHIQILEDFNPLKCQVLKAAHHGSIRGNSFEYLEVLDPRYAVISCSAASTHGFPHPLSRSALEEITYKSGSQTVERVLVTSDVDVNGAPRGTVVLRYGGGSRPYWDFLHDDINDRIDWSQRLTPPPGY